MRQTALRPLGLPVGILTAAILVLAVLALVTEDAAPLAGQGAWPPLAAVGAAAVAAAAGLFYARSESWPGRLFLVAVQGFLLAALAVLAAEGPGAPAARYLGAAAGASLLAGAAVIRHEERFLRVLPAGDPSATVADLPKCAACSTPLASQSRVLPWALLVVGDVLAGFGAYGLWRYAATHEVMQIESILHLVAAVIVGAALVGWWLAVRRFWWQCPGCGNQGRPRTAVRAPAAPAEGVSGRGFGRLQAPDPAEVCPACGGPSRSEAGLMRGVAYLAWLAAAGGVGAGAWHIVAGIEGGRPAGYLVGALLAGGGAAMIAIGVRYYAARRTARRCDLCARCFVAAPHGEAGPPSAPPPDSGPARP